MVASTFSIPAFGPPVPAFPLVRTLSVFSFFSGLRYLRWRYEFYTIVLQAVPHVLLLVFARL